MKSFWLTRRSLLVFVISCVIGGTIFWLINQNVKEKTQLQFSNDVQTLSYGLGINLNGYINVLVGFKTLVENTPTDNTMKEFCDYHKSLNHIQLFPQLKTAFFISSDNFIGFSRDDTPIKENLLPVEVQSYLEYHLRKDSRVSTFGLKQRTYQSKSLYLFDSGKKLLVILPVIKKINNDEVFYGEVGMVIELNNNLFIFPLKNLPQFNYQVLINATDGVLYQSHINHGNMYYDMPINIKENKEYFKVRLFIEKNKFDINYNIIVLSLFSTGILYLLIMILFFLSESHDRINDKAQEMTKELRHSAWYDKLTGVYNRTKAVEEISRLLEEHSQKQIIIACLDLQEFQRVNDSMGHIFGDDLLVQYSQRLKNHENFSLVSRIGGDEFLIAWVLEKNNINIVLSAMNQLMKEPFIVNGETFFINHKVGISIFPIHSENSSELLRYAELSMYEAKKNQENIVIYDPQFTDKLHYKNKLRSALSRAIENNELYLMFQPKISFLKGIMNIKGAEVLCRWNSPEFGEISPNIFIPIAEESGEIEQLGLWVFEESVKILSHWTKENIESHLSINLSPRQLLNNDLPEQYNIILSHYHVTASNITLEITENSMIENKHKSINLIKKFNQYGFNISIDDFGQGHSSLSYIKDFPISEIKLDKEFIRNISENYFDQSLVEVLVSLSRKLNLTLVVEGVETKDQVSALCKIGCHVFQGYYFTRPLKIENYVDFINKIKKT